MLKRSANTPLELDDGQTIGIAGLISDKVSEAISKFPGLGDIPILGQLFTSQQFQNNETELVIFVTPHLVKPVSPDNIRLPTDKYIEPSDTEFYWMGRTEGGRCRSALNPGRPTPVACAAISGSNPKEEDSTMKHLFHNQPASIGRLLLAASLMVLGGCAEWGSNPARMQADYGASVRKLVSNQIYNPSKARYPAALAPDGMEANKADSILNSTYRSGSTQSGWLRLRASRRAWAWVISL